MKHMQIIIISLYKCLFTCKSLFMCVLFGFNLATSIFNSCILQMYSSLVPLLDFTAFTPGTWTAFPCGDFTTLSLPSNENKSEVESSSILLLNLQILLHIIHYNQYLINSFI